MPPKQAVVDRFMESFKEILPTTVWLKEVSANSSTYDAWSVVSFNHVKDLSSTYMHEYVHLIVENTQKQLRSCMFAERDMNGDSVCVGKHNRFPSSANDLPLPLRTLTFAKDSRPKVIDVVKILQETSSLGGKYKFYTKNCWWYAGVLYKALRTKYNIEQEKNWNTSMIRSWLIATLRKKNYTEKAKLFDEERKEEWFDYIAQEGVAIQLVRKAFVAKFFDAISRKERIGDIDSIGLHISEQEAENAYKIALLEADQADSLGDTELQLDQDVEEFCSNVLAQKDADALYGAYIQKVKVKSPKSNNLANIGKPQPTDKFGRAGRAESILAMIIVLAKP